MEEAAEEWDAVELQTRGCDKQEAGKNTTLATDTSHKSIITLLPTATITFEECWKALTSEDLTEAKSKVQQLQQKEVTDAKCCTKVGWWMRRRVLTAALKKELREEMQLILALTKVPFSDSNLIHRQMLTTVYKNCSLSTAEAPSRFGPHWEYIGFQGNDPATDLRGAGIFGLLQLLAFVSGPTTKENAKMLMDLSQDAVQNFPFAIVGINITKSVLTSLKRGRLNRICNRHKSVISIINKMYNGGFCMFYNIWLGGAKTIEDSGFVLQRIEKDARKHPAKMMKTKIHNLKQSCNKPGNATDINFDDI